MTTPSKLLFVLCAVLALTSASGAAYAQAQPSQPGQPGERAQGQERSRGREYTEGKEVQGIFNHPRRARAGQQEADIVCDGAGLH